MDKDDLHRRYIVETLTAKDNDKVADSAIILWQQIATNISSIVGESGFHSLYIRSIFLGSSKFPWLASYNPKSEIGNQFAELKICFEKQPTAHIKEANKHLLITLTDILASLVGEPITTYILCMAWGDVAPDIVTKEFQNEE
ncbi:MAG: hypothetical protein ABL880_07675 [Methylotenera sp.]